MSNRKRKWFRAALAFTLVLGVASYLLLSRLPFRRSPAPIIQHAPQSSNKGPAVRPSAVRDGALIKLLPSGATLKVPSDWVEWNRKFGNNFHLTHQQLDAVAMGAGDWDTEYASVCNAVLPFDGCAAHLGDDGWGEKGVSYADLQVRVYQLDDAPETVERWIETDGKADIWRFSRASPVLERDGKSLWRRTMLSFWVSYGDYGGKANVDFRARRFGDQTFVFVFMYSDFQSQDEAITGILESFTLR